VQGSGGAAAAMSPARGRAGGTIFLEARCTSSDVRRSLSVSAGWAVRWSDEVEWCTGAVSTVQLGSYCRTVCAVKRSNQV